MTARALPVVLALVARVEVECLAAAPWRIRRTCALEPRN
jgi:hypothetical protein